jgi:two-component system, NarL family, capsular synthesis sensor histidine kinase RcsC
MKIEEIRALYVEDSSMARGVVKEYLEEIVGFLVVADDGMSGLEAFGKAAFDIVVTDIKMPVMDGFTMLEAIKKQNPLVKSIVVSAFKSDDEVARMEKLGINAFLKKPLELEELKETMLRICRVK